jgi:hypothetical protein
MFLLPTKVTAQVYYLHTVSVSFLKLPPLSITATCVSLCPSLYYLRLGFPTKILTVLFGEFSSRNSQQQSFTMRAPFSDFLSPLLFWQRMSKYFISVVQWSDKWKKYGLNTYELQHFKISQYLIPDDVIFVLRLYMARHLHRLPMTLHNYILPKILRRSE